MINKISFSIPTSPDPHFISSNNTNETKSPPSPPPPPPLLAQTQPYNPMGSSSPLQAVESIQHYLSEICSVPDENYAWENPRRFSSYIRRLELVLNQFLRSNTDQSFSASVLTALKGISGDLSKSSETLLSYREKSKIYVLINSESLRSSLQQRTVAIGGWLALLDSSVNIDSNPDLHKKTIDLSRDMKLSQFPVTENEERVYCTLRKEADGRHTSKAVQSAIMMDLARALGTDNENLSELQEQIKLLRNDVASSNSIAERRILISLERIFSSWSLDPTVAAETFGLDCEEEDTQIQPFRNFLCPLTKEVMKDPVVLESSQTYERSAIEYWFERCIEDGRDPTCPVTGQVLKSLEQKPNIGLAGAIEEWVNRNVDIQIKSAVECLDVEYPAGASPLPVENIERVCDRMYRISEDHPSSRYKIRNEGVDVLIVTMLKKCSKNIRSHLRSKALMALVSIAKNEECKQVMHQEGATRMAIHSLIGSSEKEREYAVKLLLEFSSDESYCTSLASEKGALVLLSSMAGDLEHPSLSNLAEEVLKRLEKVDDNVHPLAAAGRFEPLLCRLREGTDEIRIDMASMVGKMTLANNSKEQIARQGSKIFVDMLSKPEGTEPSLQALYNLSSCEDNATILVDSGVLLAVVDILFQAEDDKQHLKDLAASIVANIVSKPGHWELACVNDEGESMQSENIVHNLLRILPLSSPKGEVAILHILHGIASSPQASESVATHIESGGGVPIILQFLEHEEAEHRNYAFRLTRIHSDRLGQVLVAELRASNSMSLLKDKLLDTERSDSERSDSACILSNLPLTEDEVQTVLGTSLIKWIVTALKCSERTSRLSSSMTEGLLGLLLHFVRFPDPTVLEAVREHRLMTVFKDQMCSQQPRLRQRAALGLKYLSECGRTLVASTDFEPQPSTGFFASIFFCGRASKVTQSCPIHSFACEDESQFCLFKGNCIRPLVDLLNDEDTHAQITAVEALSTLVSDTPCCSRRAADELERLGVSDAVIDLFTEVRTGELQEKTIWMLERILRVESHAQRYAINQSLVRALVEAFKHGNTNTKRHAQDALTSLKQISGVSGKNSSQGKMRR